MNNKAAPKIFSPERKNRKKQFIRRLVTILLLVIILVLSYLIFKKYLKDQIFTNLKAQFETKAVVNKDNFATRVVANIDPSYFRVFEANLDERGDAIVKSEDNLVALFSKDKDISSQVYSLQTVVLQARINAKKLKKIDLRFDKIYVEYQ